MKNTLYTISSITRRILEKDHDALQELVNNQDQLVNLNKYEKENRERFIRFTLKALEQKKITDGCARRLLESLRPKKDWGETFDLYEQLFQDLAHAISNHKYYSILERIEKGEQMLAEETDEGKKAKYRAGLNKLAIELESYRPKEDAM